MDISSLLNDLDLMEEDDMLLGAGLSLLAIAPFYGLIPGDIDDVSSGGGFENPQNKNPKHTDYDDLPLLFDDDEWETYSPPIPHSGGREDGPEGPYSPPPITVGDDDYSNLFVDVPIYSPWKGYQDYNPVDPNPTRR
jgi:hypothetical protein